MGEDDRRLLERGRLAVGTAAGRFGVLGVVMGLAAALGVASCRGPAQSSVTTITPAATPELATTALVDVPTPRPTSPGATPLASRRTMPVRQTATGTVTPRRAAVFRADATEIEPGGCCWLSWQLPGARQVTLDGQVAPASGTRQVCPTETTVYRLRWLGPDGEPASRAVTVTVRAPLLTLAVAPPRFEERPQPTKQAGEPGGAATPTGCTPCGGATRRPTATRPPAPTEAPLPSESPVEPTAPLPTAAPSATGEGTTPEPPPLPTAGESPTAASAR